VNWLWFTLFVGVNLFQSGLTRFCPLDLVLKMFGVKDGGVVTAAGKNDRQCTRLRGRRKWLHPDFKPFA